MNQHRFDYFLNALIFFQIRKTSNQSRMKSVAFKTFPNNSLGQWSQLWNPVPAPHIRHGKAHSPWVVAMCALCTIAITYLPSQVNRVVTDDASHMQQYTVYILHLRMKWLKGSVLVWSHKGCQAQNFSAFVYVCSRRYNLLTFSLFANVATT